MKTKITGLQKAAWFLVTLGTEISAIISKYLNEAEIKRLKKEMAKVPKLELSKKEKRAIIMEFKIKFAKQEQEKEVADKNPNEALLARSEKLAGIVRIENGEFFAC
ncbi:MAG: hypothetical protein V1649_00275 [Patescibacteria group bacterium]